MHLPESGITHMHLTGVTESHLYALKDHTYAFNIITKVCI